MASTFDVVVGLFVAALVAYLASKYFGGGEPQVDSFTSAMNASTLGGGDKRDIVAKMAKNGKNVVVFYGSQTGTAEDLASKLAKEMSAKFGFKTMTADLEDYDYENLDTFPEDNLAVFCMASYGEGEPTDNAAPFWSFLFDSEPEFSNGPSIENLHYAVFGLGNNTYEKFNEVGRTLDKRLAELGGHRVGEYGEGDDGDGSMEEDFLEWKANFLSTLKSERGLEERDYVYEPTLEVEEALDVAFEDPSVYVGQPNQNHLEGVHKGPFNQMNPFLAPIKETYELFNSAERNCVHCEFDIGDSGLRYTTGDHLAFWCQNSNEEVDRFLEAFGLLKKRDEVITIKPLDNTAQLRIPSPTTYDTVVRYFLEINGPVSRQVLSNIASFAPSEATKKRAKALGGDKDLFAKEVSSHYYNLSRLLLHLSDGKPWDVPFNFIVENIPHIQPRYYSISSSSGEDKSTISITAVVERARPAGSNFVLKGVATNKIFDILNTASSKSARNYKLEGPRGTWQSGSILKTPVSVRHSNFKLPTKAETPIIMVGPGTGVAPFRGFIRERAHIAKEKPIGKALLFFGCRQRSEDALYSEEWQKYSKPATDGKIDGTFGADDFLEVINAFSREKNTKVYVQQRMKEHAKLVNALLENGAYFYVCGDASHMAREVQSTLSQILSQERKIDLAEADQLIKKMKARNIYQEDVW